MDDEEDSQVQHSCQTCGKDFKQKSKLQRHIQETHMNLQNFICTICQQSFKRNSHLKRHFVTHSENPKPFKCEYDSCYMSFGCKHHLTRHIQTLHLEEKRFQCPLCPDFEVEKQVQLSQHNSMVHGEKMPYSCGFERCNQQFFRLGQLQTHQKEAHQISSAYKTININTQEFDQQQEENDENDSQIYSSTDQYTDSGRKIKRQFSIIPGPQKENPADRRIKGQRQNSVQNNSYQKQSLQITDNVEPPAGAEKQEEEEEKIEFAIDLLLKQKRSILNIQNEVETPDQSLFDIMNDKSQGDYDIYHIKPESREYAHKEQEEFRSIGDFIKKDQSQDSQSNYKDSEHQNKRPISLNNSSLEQIKDLVQIPSQLEDKKSAQKEQSIFKCYISECTKAFSTNCKATYQHKKSLNEHMHNFHHLNSVKKSSLEITSQSEDNGSHHEIEKKSIEDFIIKKQSCDIIYE